MTFKLKDILHKSLSDSVFNDLFTGRSNYYYFIGKVVPYTGGTVPTPDETRIVEQDTRNRIINLKKITAGDVSLAIPRKNWSTGTIYDQFDLNYSSTNPASSGAETLKLSNFYVISSSFQVYKCISNNGGEASTVEPSGNLLDVFTTSDGYQWKFMYTIPLSLRSRFLTDDFMPVTKSVLESFYSDGQINSVTVDSKGSGYTTDPVVNLVANVHFITANDGTASVPGANTPNIKPIINETTGAIEDVIVLFAGSNIAGGNVLINDSESTGSNLFPNVTFSIGSNAAVSQTLISNSANFIPVISGGELKDVIILDPGKNYTSNGNTIISVSGDGTGAVIKPLINDAGELENAIISEKGQGYTNAVLNVIGSGTGASLSVSFSTGDLSTSQSIVELSAIDGAIHNYTIVSGGTQYNVIPTISITGDGTGATATATGDFGSGNSITGITVTNAGSGYTFANVVVTAAAGSPGTDADIQPIFSPPNGHGFDAPTELFADSLMFFSTLSDEKIHNIPINNDFRQFGIIKDIEQSGSKKLFGNVTGTPSFLATFDNIDDSSPTAGGTNPISNDVVLELKSDNTRKFVVIETKNSTTQMLLTSLNNHTLAISDILVSPTGNEFTVSSINSSPDINKFSGEMLFIDNRTAVTFSDEQLVTFRTILRL